MIADPIMVSSLRESNGITVGFDLFFLYDDRLCIGVATGVSSNYNEILYKWFIEIFDDRKTYYTNSGGKSAEDLVAYLEKFYPGHLEWLLFHPEWL